MYMRGIVRRGRLSYKTLNKWLSFSLTSHPKQNHQAKQRSNQTLGPSRVQVQGLLLSCVLKLVWPPPPRSRLCYQILPPPPGERAKAPPPFPDTCSNPWWNVSEKTQEEFLKYISL
jgi:hypothetical protein